MKSDTKKGKKCKTPLLCACQKENEAIVKYLVDHGADVNVRNNNEDNIDFNDEEVDDEYDKNDDNDDDNDDDNVDDDNNSTTISIN